MGNHMNRPDREPRADLLGKICRSSIAARDGHDLRKERHVIAGLANVPIETAEIVNAEDALWDQKTTRKDDIHAGPPSGAITPRSRPFIPSRPSQDAPP
jgi:hypothetical protein